MAESLVFWHFGTNEKNERTYYFCIGYVNIG